VSKRERRLQRLLSRPRDLSWEELTAVLSDFGYEARSSATRGSARTFVNSLQPSAPIKLHEPHPRPIVKRYAIDQVIEELARQGLIDEEHN